MPMTRNQPAMSGLALSALSTNTGPQARHVIVSSHVYGPTNVATALVPLSSTVSAVTLSACEGDPPVDQAQLGELRSAPRSSNACTPPWTDRMYALPAVRCTG